MTTASFRLVKDGTEPSLHQLMHIPSRRRQNHRPPRQCPTGPMVWRFGLTCSTLMLGENLTGLRRFDQPSRPLIRRWRGWRFTRAAASEASEASEASATIPRGSIPSAVHMSWGHTHSHQLEARLLGLANHPQGVHSTLKHRQSGYAFGLQSSVRLSQTSEKPRCLTSAIEGEGIFPAPNAGARKPVRALQVARRFRLARSRRRRP